MFICFWLLSCIQDDVFMSMQCLYHHLRMDNLAGFARSVPVIVVHCERGANRSPAVAAVILALAKGCTFEEAVPWLKNQLLLKGLKP